MKLPAAHRVHKYLEVSGTESEIITLLPIQWKRAHLLHNARRRYHTPIHPEPARSRVLVGGETPEHTMVDEFAKLLQIRFPIPLPVLALQYSQRNALLQLAAHRSFVESRSWRIEVTITASLSGLVSKIGAGLIDFREQMREITIARIAIRRVDSTIQVELEGRICQD